MAGCFASASGRGASFCRWPAGGRLNRRQAGYATRRDATQAHGSPKPSKSRLPGRCGSRSRVSGSRFQAPGGTIRPWQDRPVAVRTVSTRSLGSPRPPGGHPASDMWQAVLRASVRGTRSEASLHFQTRSRSSFAPRLARVGSPCAARAPIPQGCVQAGEHSLGLSCDMTQGTQDLDPGLLLGDAPLPPRDALLDLSKVHPIPRHGRRRGVRASVHALQRR